MMFTTMIRHLDRLLATSALVPSTGSTAHTHLGVVGVVQGESVVDAFRQDDEVTFAAPNADPTVIKVAHVEVAWEG